MTLYLTFSMRAFFGAAVYPLACGIITSSRVHGAPLSNTPHIMPAAPRCLAHYAPAGICLRRWHAPFAYRAEEASPRRDAAGSASRLRTGKL